MRPPLPERSNRSWPKATLAGVPLLPGSKEGKHARKVTYLGERLSRRVNAAFVHAALVRRGDADAGAIYIKVAAMDGTARFSRLFQRRLPSDSERSLIMEEGRAWQPVNSHNAREAEADAYLVRQAGRDPDIWILEVEAVQGRHLSGETAKVMS